MSVDTIRQPSWPEPTFATKEEAIADAVAHSDIGDGIVVHEDGCALRYDADCDCTPSEMEVRKE